MAKRSIKNTAAATSALTTVEEITLTSTPSTALVVIPTDTAPEAAIEVEAPVEAVEDNRPALVSLTIFGARITSQTIIHPKLWGTERWFAKKRLTSFTKNADGSITLVLPAREIEYRDCVLTEPLATVTPYAYPVEEIAETVAA